MDQPTIAIVGCGRVGAALCQALFEAGFSILGLATKTEPSRVRVQARFSRIKTSVVPWEVTAGADLVWITTPDDQINPVCEAIAAHGGFAGVKYVYHCSGSLPSSILVPAAEMGIGTGGFHPLQSFLPEMSGNPFSGIVIALEGEDGAVQQAETLVAALGGRAIRIHTSAKTLYHTAAVVASNYLVTLMHFAFDCLGRSGIAAEDAYQVLQPLITGTLGNIAKVGPLHALTGPIARGDGGTVAEHLRALADTPWKLLYQILGCHTLELAKSLKPMDPASQAILEKLLQCEPAPAIDLQGSNSE